MFRLAYLREGKQQPELGAQLDFSYPDRTNVSAIAQWGPALENSHIAFTFWVMKTSPLYRLDLDITFDFT